MSQLASFERNPVQKLQTLRGRELASQELIQQGLSALRPEWDPGFQIGPLVLPMEDSVKHICFVGSPGSGKTVLIRLLMQSVLPLIGQEWKGAVSHEDVRKSLLQSVSAVIPTPRIVPPVIAPPVDSRSPEPKVAPKTVTTAKNPGLFVFILFSFPLCVYLAIPFFLGEVSDYRKACIAGGFFAVWAFFLSKVYPVETKTETVVAPAPPPASEPTVVQPVPPKRLYAYQGPVQWEKHRALIYDAKQEVLPQLAGMNLTGKVVVLNPFDSRSAAWDMAADIDEPATAKQIAAIFIPEEKNASQPFFADAARHLLEGVMLAFILTRPGQWTFRDVLVALKSTERLKAVLSQVPETSDLIETYLSHERESKSIAATLATKLGPFDVVAALWESATEKISLREWLDSEYILVLGNDESYRTSLDVVNRVIFKRVVELLLAKPGTTDGRTWFS